LKKVVKKLSKNCQKVVKKVVKKLSKSCQKCCQKVVKKLSKSCQKVVKKLSKKLSKSCQKVVQKLLKFLSHLGKTRGAPFDVFLLPAVTRNDWNLLVLIRFLLHLMTSQTSGAGQEAAGLGGGPRNNKV
jgi:hypothetical protein